MAERKYKFSWDLIGDIKLGRPNLGPFARLEVYRLLQFAFRDVLEQNFGTEQSDVLFREAGNLAGRHFYQKFCSHCKDLSEFVTILQDVLQELGIGVLRVEQADEKKGYFVLTVAEDLDCSGLPELEYEICAYDEGFIAGLMESFGNTKFDVKEIDCWCTGARICRFTAQAQK